MLCSMGKTNNTISYWLRRYKQYNAELTERAVLGYLSLLKKIYPFRAHADKWNIIIESISTYLSASALFGFKPKLGVATLSAFCSLYWIANITFHAYLLVKQPCLSFWKSCHFISPLIIYYLVRTD